MKHRAPQSASTYNQYRITSYNVCYTKLLRTHKKVIVIGAGLAGLVCAYELGQAGYNVKVLEAQGRVGGCVKTVRNAFKNGQYADVGGASFYPIAQDYARNNFV